MSQWSAVIRTSGGIACRRTISDSFTQFHHLISDLAFRNKINFLGYLINQKQVIAVGANAERHNGMCALCDRPGCVGSPTQPLPHHHTHTMVSFLLSLATKLRWGSREVSSFPSSWAHIISDRSINLIGFKSKAFPSAGFKLHQIRVLILRGLHDLMCATLYMQPLVTFNACFPHGFHLKQLGDFKDGLYAHMPQAIFTRL